MLPTSGRGFYDCYPHVLGVDILICLFTYHAPTFVGIIQVTKSKEAWRRYVAHKPIEGAHVR